MAKPYLLRPLAEADLKEIWLYTARLWSVEQADSYIRGFVDAFEGLAKGGFFCAYSPLHLTCEFHYTCRHA